MYAGRRRKPTEPNDSLQISHYEDVTSWLVALLLFIGFFVTLLGLIWLTKVFEFKQVAIPIEFVEEKSGRGEAAKGYARDLAEPGLEELEELQEPQLQATLEAVSTMVSTKMAALDSLNTDATQTGKGSGLGDSRGEGEGGDGDSIPRWERWQIEYESDSLNKYAAQLDFFGIELGAAGGGRKFIDYARNFARGGSTRQGSGKEEKRLYFTWNSGTLRRMDSQLLGRAGVTTTGRVTLQFYPPKLEEQLFQLEMRNAVEKFGIKNPRYLRKTIFKVQSSGSGFQFKVVNQIRRDLPT